MVSNSDSASERRRCRSVTLFDICVWNSMEFQHIEISFCEISRFRIWSLMIPNILGSLHALPRWFWKTWISYDFHVIVISCEGSASHPHLPLQEGVPQVGLLGVSFVGFFRFSYNFMLAMVLIVLVCFFSVSLFVTASRGCWLCSAILIAPSPQPVVRWDSTSASVHGV